MCGHAERTGATLCSFDEDTTLLFLYYDLKGTSSFKHKRGIVNVCLLATPPLQYKFGDEGGNKKVNRMSFGTKQTCSIFQNVNKIILAICPGCMDYMDDVVVTGSNDKH